MTTIIFMTSIEFFHNYYCIIWCHALVYRVWVVTACRRFWRQITCTYVCGDEASTNSVLGGTKMSITEQWIRDRLNLQINSLGITAAIWRVALLYSVTVVCLCRRCEVSVTAWNQRRENHPSGKVSTRLHSSKAPRPL